MIYSYVFSEWRSVSSSGDQTVSGATHYDFTVSYDIARDAHFDITMGNEVTRDIHCDVTMSNDVAMCTYIMTMYNDIAMNLFYLPSKNSL